MREQKYIGRTHNIYLMYLENKTGQNIEIK